MVVRGVPVLKGGVAGAVSIRLRGEVGATVLALSRVRAAEGGDRGPSRAERRDAVPSSLP